MNQPVQEIFMIKKLVLAFAILALATAFGGGVSGAHYKITLLQPSVVKGTELKAGEYRLQILNDTATLTGQKLTVDVPVKVETNERKYDSTAIRYIQQDGKAMISEIRIGGTKTKLLINQ
jgi:hypothetical protein